MYWFYRYVYFFTKNIKENFLFRFFFFYVPQKRKTIETLNCHQMFKMLFFLIK